jgi:hypothetical protein
MGGVVDGDVHDVPTGPVGRPAAGVAPGDSVAGTVETAELLDVDESSGHCRAASRVSLK